MHVASLRPLARRAVPHPLRWRLRASVRALHDARVGVRFASRRDARELTQRVCAYTLPIARYPGQEQRYDGKVRNLSLAMGAIDGAIVMPGEVLSFWRLVGRPTRAAGYTEAAALKAGRLTEEIGGSICLASTVLYNVGLLAGMSILERYCHSVDTYGDARYFELGRDAAVEYAYRDLRMRNELDVPLAIRAAVCDGRVFAEACSSPDLRLDVQLEVSPIAHVGSDAIEVRAWRTVSLGGRTWTEDLGRSHHDPPPAEPA